MRIPKIFIKTANLSNALYEIADEVRQKIVTRTQAGQDVNHKAFTEYTEAYKKYKQKTGKSGKPNLTKSSLMLRSLVLTKHLRKTLISITNTDNREIIGQAHNYGNGNMPKRYWFGINKPDADMIYLRVMPKHQIAGWVK